MSETSNVICEIAQERARQRLVKGYDAAHDAKHTNGQLIEAACTYALYSRSLERHKMVQKYSAMNFAPPMWPWETALYAPESQREDLVKAAALLVAEIERLDREKGFVDG